MRMEDSRLPKHLLYGEMREGERSVRGQKKRHIDHIKTILRKCDLDPVPIALKHWLPIVRSGVLCATEVYSALKER